MTKAVTFVTTLVALLHAAAAEPRPPPGRPDREASHPCFPSDRDTVGGNADGSLPPCVRQAKIMEACGIDSNDGNLTSSEMQQCVCDGSFFEDTIGCGACLNYQDIISQDQYDEGSSIVSSISSAYCSAGQTGDLDSVLGDIKATSTVAGLWSPSESPTTRKPTAVSNYFTATADQQGPGIESLVTQRTLTGEAPTSEPTDDGVGALLCMGWLGNLSLVTVVVALLMN